MPIYEYICQGCKENFSKLQSISSSQEGIACPACGSLEIKKIISAFGVCSAGPASSPLPAGGSGFSGG